MWAERGNIYLDRSQTHECGNWDSGHAIPFLGIHKSKFLCSVTHLAKPSSGVQRDSLKFFPLVRESITVTVYHGITN
jgi:hypothetical protein